MQDNIGKVLTSNSFLKRYGAFLVHLVTITVVGGTCMIAALPLLLIDSVWVKALFLALMPLLVPAAMIALCAVISRPFQRAIVSGLFPRDLSLPLYFGRRVYGSCLAALMHFSGLYYLILSMPWLKKAMFRSFGYEGSHCNFTAYTDVWMRDLKLLELGDGAYLGNQSTLGTNICTTDGNILVGRIKIGDQSQLGRLCILGPGTRLGQNCETGVRTIMGIRAVAKDRVKIAGATVVSHGVLLENDVSVGEYSYIGSKAHIHAGISLPVASHIKAGTILLTQDDANMHSERQVDEIQNTIMQRMALMQDSPLKLMRQ